MAAYFLVVAGAKGVGTLSRQDDDADLRILTANFERIVQFDDSLRAKGIAHFRPVDGDLGDALFHALKKKILIRFYRDPCFHLISSRVELIGLLPFYDTYGRPAKNPLSRRNVCFGSAADVRPREFVRFAKNGPRISLPS